MFSENSTREFGELIGLRSDTKYLDNCFVLVFDMKAVHANEVLVASWVAILAKHCDGLSGQSFVIGQIDGVLVVTVATFWTGCAWTLNHLL